MVWYNRKVAL